jgi:hypothetical protein
MCPDFKHIGAKISVNRKEKGASAAFVLAREE